MTLSSTASNSPMLSREGSMDSQAIETALTSKRKTEVDDEEVIMAEFDCTLASKVSNNIWHNFVCTIKIIVHK